jgi:hypothetical protein
MAIDDEHLDHQLRVALAPPPDQVDRIVRQALAAAGEDGRLARRPPLRLAPAASLLAVLAAAATFFFLHVPRPRPSPSREAVVSIVNVGGVVIASSTEEQRPLILSGTSETDPPGIILIRHGDLP